MLFDEEGEFSTEREKTLIWHIPSAVDETPMVPKEIYLFQFAFLSSVINHTQVIKFIHIDST